MTDSGSAPVSSGSASGPAADYSYATSILTSSLPQQAASILPSSLNTTSQVVDQFLLPWFSAYANHLQNTNKSLTHLLNTGSTYFPPHAANTPEFGNLPKLWNCLLNAVQLNIHTNEQLYKQLKLESIGPLKDLSSNNNVRFSELLVNSQELQEIAQSLSPSGANADPQAEYHWNIKAPQIFDNFENFKSVEKQLYFNAVFNFFQGQNSLFSKNLSNNENSTNYLLSNFKIDTEMNNYLQYLLQNYLPNAPTAKKNGAATGAGATAAAAGGAGAAVGAASAASPRHHDNHSIQSATSSPSTTTPTSKAAKRQSKLKSKVGSIFGRKHKKSPASSPTAGVAGTSLSNDAIPESASSTSSLHHHQPAHHSAESSSQLNRSNTTISRHSSVRRQPSVGHGAGSAAGAGIGAGAVGGAAVGAGTGPSSVAQPRTPQHGSFQSSQFQQHQQHQQSQSQQPPQPQRQPSGPIQSLNSAPLTPSSPFVPTTVDPRHSKDPQFQQQQQRAQSPPQQPSTPQPKAKHVYPQQQQQPQDSPNVVKYRDEDESSSDDDVPIDSRGNRLSMLQKHDLDTNSDVGNLNEYTTAPTTATSKKHDDINGGTTFAPIDPPSTLNPRSRQSSDGKYSFEAGDENKPISAKTTPRQVQSNQFDAVSTAQPAYHSEQPLPEPNVYDESPIRTAPNSANDNASGKNKTLSSAAALGGAAAAGGAVAAGVAASVGGTGSTSSSVPADKSGTSSSHRGPPPPPSRKVVHSSSTSIPTTSATGGDAPSTKSRKDVHSQIFHNLPNARESYVQPQSTQGIPGAFPDSSVAAPVSGTPFGSSIANNGSQTLISQSTGNSILKHNDLFKHNFDDAKEGLNSSVAEIINVTFKNGSVVKSQVIGEVAFNYNDAAQQGASQPILISVPNKLDKFVVNEQFLKPVGQQVFEVNPSLILSKTLGGLKYLLKLNESQVPIFVKQIWKFENHQASVILLLQLNPRYSSKISLHNLVISASLDSSVETVSASSKPEGSFNKDKKRITWRYPKPLVLYNSGPESGGDENSNQEKIIARILTKGLSSEHESGIQVKFSLSDPPVKYAQILDSNNTEIPSVRNLISGAYSSHS